MEHQIGYMINNQCTLSLTLSFKHVVRLSCITYMLMCMHILYKNDFIKFDLTSF